MTVPTKSVAPARVAELPTFQNTLHADAPPVRVTEALEPVTSVDPAWKTKTLLGPPLKVREPFTCMDDPAL